MFKTPSPKMAGFITVILLVLFALVLLAPVIFPGKTKDFDASLIQTLLVLLVGAVGFYLGSSKSSEDKSAVIAAQVVPPPVAPSGVIPTGTPGDPVSVHETSKGSQ